ncbi:BLUF domain-containing protein [Endozoicomonadaceae bacterium StTr2]
MYYMIYISTATTLMTEEELTSILETARHNNASNNITGMLLYSNGTFMQVLEGEDRDKLQALYQTIEQDKRHHSIIRMIEGETRKRQFPDWSMGFNHIEHETAETSGFNNFMAQSAEITDKSTMESTAWRLLLLFRRNNPS